MINFEICTPKWGERIDNERFERALSRSMDSAFCDIPLLEAQREKAESRAQHILSHYDQTVYVGIGGSYWTPNSINTYFFTNSDHQLFFLDSPESKSFHALFKRLSNLKRTHFIFISKSGSTLEPLSLLSSLIHHFESHSMDLSRQSTLICSPGNNPMRTWADEEEVPVLEIPAEIGGRYSSLTPVGLLATELLGLSCRDLLDGAKAGKEQKDLVRSLSYFGLHSFEEKLPITQMWTYSDSLWPLGQWWQQLWSESLAKKDGPRVSTPMVCCGPRDQHSLFQQLMDGERDKAVLLLRDEFLDRRLVPLGTSFSDREEFKGKDLFLADVFRSEIEGFCGALNQNEIPLGRLSADFSRIQTWGEYFMSWQLTVAAMGNYLGVNPFDQPGVELGKVLARQYLKSMNIKES